MNIEEVEKRLHLYKTVLYPQHPFVHIPQDLALELIKDQPFLFNTVMVMVNGSKTMELVKSLAVLSVWYKTQECFKLRRYHPAARRGLVHAHREPERQAMLVSEHIGCHQPLHRVVF